MVKVEAEDRPDIKTLDVGVTHGCRALRGNGKADWQVRFDGKIELGL